MTLVSLQVETMHDFEAANSDELELKRGDVVLVVPTESVEDQVRTRLVPASPGHLTDLLKNKRVCGESSCSRTTSG